jgi:hypothetical protein
VLLVTHGIVVNASRHPAGVRRDGGRRPAGGEPKVAGRLQVP